MVGSNLLSHDDNLVPFSVRVTACGCFHAASGINERVSVTPNEIDFAKFRQQILAAGVCGQCTVDQIRSLVIQTVCHVEICLGHRIGLIKVDRRFTTEGILQ